MNPVSLAKPTSYDGKDLAKFKPWWMKVESYIETYSESFPTDQHRINWVGSLLTEKAQLWHQQRVAQTKRMGLRDHWSGYASCLAARFHDPAEKHRNAKAMSALPYKGDTSQYLTELLDLNEVVQWSGTMFQNHIAKTLPDEITKLVYSRQGGLPETDDEFIDAIKEAGLIYETMRANPGINHHGGSSGNKLGKEGPTSTSEHSKSGQPRKDTRSKSGSNPSLKKDGDTKKTGGSKPDLKEKRWASNKVALVGIDQSDIDKFKKENKACWRCGRDNHQTLACFARKNIDGKDLPPAPEKTSSVNKRKSEEEPQPDSAKRAKVDALMTRPTPTTGYVIEEDSDSDF
ncbi:hypothetical protein NUW58_g6004 [Xylaria curta]|uniref:Uncharacterized protein n=1 Tax=Xylaria curta TaxID=42375 RepID=A0ACC1P141_9PEZI|nr:hypothetical protein NUW58_g6004 [Xylaria curta]